MDMVSGNQRSPDRIVILIIRPSTLHAAISVEIRPRVSTKSPARQSRIPTDQAIAAMH